MRCHDAMTGWRLMGLDWNECALGWEGRAKTNHVLRCFSLSFGFFQVSYPLRCAGFSLHTYLITFNFVTLLVLCALRFLWCSHFQVDSF